MVLLAIKQISRDENPFLIREIGSDMIRENQRLLNHLNVLTDLALLFLSMLLAYFIRFHILGGQANAFNLHQYLQLTVVLVPVHLITYSFFDLYESFRSKTFRKEFSLIVKANIVLMVASIVVLYVFKMVDVSRWLIVIFFFTTVTLISLKRLLLRKVLTNIRVHGYNTKSVIVIGAGDTARQCLDVIKKNKSYGYLYAGYVAEETEFEGTRLGGFADLYRVLSKQNTDEVICAIDMKDAGRLEDIVSACEKSGTKISFIPFCYQYIPSRPYIDQFDGIPLINLRRIPLDNLGNAFLKRTLDIVGSIVLIILTSPIMLFTAIGVKLTSPGPVIFRQQRVGLNKHIFTMYKFRSMYLNGRSETAWSTNEDDRRTKFGAFIRKFSLDEFPQFFNVLKGDMSLVGPRPELPHFVDGFKDQIPLYMVKHQVKPGITGLAQIHGYRGNTSIKKRVEYDVEYIENWSFFLDLKILFTTAFRAFKNDEKLKVQNECLPRKSAQPQNDLKEADKLPMQIH